MKSLKVCFNYHGYHIQRYILDVTNKSDIIKYPDLYGKLVIPLENTAGLIFSNRIHVKLGYGC